MKSILKRIKDLFRSWQCYIRNRENCPWEYSKDSIVKCERRCKECGRIEHSTYDMSFGTTLWREGQWWENEDYWK